MNWASTRSVGAFIYEGMEKSMSNYVGAGRGIITSMSRRMKTILILIIVIGIVLILAYVNLLKIQNALLLASRDSIRASLEKAVGAPVRFDGIYGKSLSKIVVSGLSVNVSSDQIDSDFLIDRVEVSYSLFDVLSKRKDIIKAVRGITLIEPEISIRLPSDLSAFRKDIDQKHLSDISGQFQGYISTKDGRIEISGIPGITVPFVISGINGSIKSMGAAAAGHISLFLGDEKKVRILLTGKYDFSTGAVTCDAGLTGEIPDGFLHDVKNVLDSEMPVLLGIKEESLINARDFFADIDTANVGGGTVDIEAHIRPKSKDNALIRGKLTIADMALNIPDINLTGLSADAGCLLDLKTNLNLILDFQADDRCSSYKGEGIASIRHVQWADSRFGLPGVSAEGEIKAEFWKTSEDTLTSFEGTVALNIPDLPAGEILRQATGLTDGILQIESPVFIDLAFAGKSWDDIDILGNLRIDKGLITAENIIPEVQKAVADIKAYIGFESEGGILSGYRGEIELLSGYAYGSYPDQGIESAYAHLNGALNFSSGQGEPLAYGGVINIGEAGIGLTHKFQANHDYDSSEEEYYGEIKIPESRINGKMEFQGEYPGSVKFAGLLGLDGSMAEISGTTGTAGLRVTEGGVSGDLIFQGEMPGKVEYGAAVGLSEGLVRLSSDSPWLGQALGQISGDVKISGDTEGKLTYDGGFKITEATMEVSETPLGIEKFSGGGSADLKFRGGNDTDLQYEGCAYIDQGDFLAKGIVDGMERLEGPIAGSISFKSEQGKAPDINGTMFITGNSIDISEIQGFIKSAKGEAKGEIHFSMCGGELLTYSGEGVIEKATFVSDGVMPELVKARGEATFGFKFLLSDDGEIIYDAKAKIHSGKLRANNLYPGLESVTADVTSEFSFGSSENGVKYGGIVNILSGEILIKDAIEGLDYMDGDITATLKFQGDGTKGWSLQGDAVISEGMLRASQITKGFESIEGAARLEAAFFTDFNSEMAYSGTLVIDDALFIVSDILDGVKSVVGNAGTTIQFESNPSGLFSFDCKADVWNVSFAAGKIYSGIRELGGNGSAKLILGRGAKGDLYYSGEVKVTEGTLNLDSIGGRLDNVTAELAFDTKSLDIRGVTGNFGKSKFEASGLIGFEGKPELDIRVRSRELVLEDLGEITIAGEPLNMSGIAGLDIIIKGLYPGPELMGEIELSGVDIEHPIIKLPAENVQGRVRLLGNDLNLEHLLMNFMDSPVIIEGSVTNILNPQFDINVFFEDISLTRAKEVFIPDMAGDIQGRGKVDLNIIGSPAEVWVNGDFALSDLSWDITDKPIKADEAKGRFRYGNNAITLNEVAISAIGGEINVDGVVLLKEAEDEPVINPWTQLSFNIKEASVADAVSYIPLEDIEASGVLNAGAVLEIEKGVYSLIGSCSVTSGSIQGYPFDNIKAEFKADNNRIMIDRLDMISFGSQLRGKGIIYDSTNYNLELAAELVDLKKIEEIFGYEGISGTGSFAGTVSSKNKDISLKGLVEITAPVINGIKLDSITGWVGFKDSAVSLSNILITQGNAGCQVSGLIKLHPEDPSLDLSANFKGLPVDEILPLINKEEIPLEGLLSGKVDIKGTLGNPEINGNIRLSEGEVLGTKLDNISTGFKYAADIIDIYDLNAVIGSLRIASSGCISLGGTLDLTVNIQDFDLLKFPLEIPGDFLKGGSAGFGGNITGEITSPRIEGKVSAKNVMISDAIIPDIVCDLIWGDGEVHITNARVSDGTGVLEIEGGIQLIGDHPMDFVLNAQGLDVKTVLAVLAPGRSDPVEGTLTGKINISGALPEPIVDLELNTDNLAIGGIPFKSASLNAGVAEGSVDIKLLQLFQAENRYLEATGNADIDGAVSLIASARHFDISVLSSVAGWDYPFKGDADFAMKIEGEFKDPSVVLSLRISEGSISDIGFHLITAEMAFKNGTVIISDGEILQGDYRATIHGTIPIPKKGLEAIGITAYPPTEDLDIKVRIIKARLGLISTFLKEVEWAEGETNVDLHITGTAAAPKLYGSAEINNGTIKFSPIINTFTKIDAGVKFKGTYAEIERFVCLAGDGEIRARGEVVFSDQERQSGFNLDLTTEDALINTGVFHSLISSDIKVSGPFNHPLISGSINLIKTIASPDTWSFTGMPLFNADLDLDVATEGDLRLRTRIMDIPASGSVKIKGTLAEPRISGTMEARRGWFAYVGNEFAIRRAVAEFSEQRGVMPQLEIEADTTSAEVKIFVELHGIPPDDLILELSSSPPMAYDEILALLNYPGALTKILSGDIEGAVKEELARIFEQELRLRMTGGIGRAFEDLLALDEFRFRRSTSNELTLRIGKYIIDSLYLSYEKSLGPESHGILKFDYFYRPGIVLTGRFDERGEKIFSIEARFKF